MIAIMLTVELLSFSPASQRTLSIMRALQLAAGSTVKVQPTTSYQGASDVLVIWGPGAPDRAAAMATQIKRGGRVLALDLAYWERETKFRVSIDAPHPQAWVMRRDWPSSRLTRDKVEIRNAWRPDGPVVIAGIGKKARVQYGADEVDRWERQMIAEVNARWPRRKVLYRKKRPESNVPAGVMAASARPIDQLLSGASLVITWHSNVGVDAIRMGIPVICRDGAAAAVCASNLGEGDPQPLPTDVRDRFLRNLAWFQWLPREAVAFWAWASEALQ